MTRTKVRKYVPLRAGELAKRRKAAGYETMAEFATAITTAARASGLISHGKTPSVTASHISNWERDGGGIHATYLNVVAFVLNCQPSDLTAN